MSSSNSSAQVEEILSPVKREDNVTSYEKDYSILKEKKRFDNLTELMNLPVDVNFHAQLENIYGEPESKLEYLLAIGKGLRFHCTEGLVDSDGTLPKSRYNYRAKRDATSSSPSLNESARDYFSYRCYEFFHFNIVDGTCSLRTSAN